MNNDPGRQEQKVERGAGATAGRKAFTLIEVMIAAGILFMCLFAILALLANSLRNARALQRKTTDAGMAAAQLYFELTNTNQVTEGSGEGDFGELFPNSRYEYTIEEVGTNGLCQVDIVLRERGQADSKMTILMYLPTLKKFK